MRQIVKKAVRQLIQESLEGIGNDLVNELVRVAPVDTGFLRNSISYSVKGQNLTIKMPIYALYIEFGTAPHEIRAINAKALHWKQGGQNVFAKVVHHPGTEPNPFIRTTLNTKFSEIVNRNLQRTIQKHNGEINVNT